MPRTEVAALAKYTVIKYFSKPIKFDIFFASIGKILKAHFMLDDTPCLIETHVNGNIIFIEVARGLNKDKIQLLRYRLTELIASNNLREPKVLIMMSGISLSFVDGYNLELLFDNILEEDHILLKNVKILTLDPFTKELIDGHPQYNGIEIAESLDSVINSLIDANQSRNLNELVSEKILTATGSEESCSTEMRFEADTGKNDDKNDLSEVLRVAIVDDDPITVKLVQSAFISLSANTSAFMTGQSFLDAIENNQVFDLIILDIFIPDLNGLEILKRLQKMSFKTPVIIYSQATLRESVIQALSLGASSYLVKPQKPDVIVQKALEILNGHV